MKLHLRGISYTRMKRREESIPVGKVTRSSHLLMFIRTSWIGGPYGKEYRFAALLSTLLLRECGQWYTVLRRGALCSYRRKTSLMWDSGAPVLANKRNSTRVLRGLSVVGFTSLHRRESTGTVDDEPSCKDGG